MTHPAVEDVGPRAVAVMSAPGEAVITLEGDLDIASVPVVRERLLSLLRPGACRLVIDMSAVRYADASGLEVLVSTRRRAVLLGGTLRLTALRPEVARVLTVAGLSRRDADPRRQFSLVLGALAQADAGTSDAALARAARSLLSVLGREPLTYSPAVAATASRLRRLFPPGPRSATG